MNSFQKHDGSPARIALLTAFIISLILLLSQRDGPNFTKPAQRIELRAELAGLRDNQARLDLLQLKIKRYERIISTNGRTYRSCYQYRTKLSASFALGGFE